MRISGTDRVRQFVAEQYVRPARSRGKGSFTVVIGDVHHSLGFRNRVNLVSTALRSSRFLQENHVLLKQIDGSLSGLGTRITFELEANESAGNGPQHPLWCLLGQGKEMFQALGGGEAFIRREREDLYRL